MIEIVLKNQKPYSTNNLYRCYRNRIVKDLKYIDWIEVIKTKLRNEYNQPMLIFNQLTVEIEYHITTKRKIDIDNCIKSLFDACNKIIWEDDSQVYKVTASKIKSDEDFIKMKINIL